MMKRRNFLKTFFIPFVGVFSAAIPVTVSVAWFGKTKEAKELSLAAARTIELLNADQMNRAFPMRTIEAGNRAGMTEPPYSFHTHLFPDEDLGDGTYRHWDLFIENGISDLERFEGTSFGMT